ncbi:hypothetical protein BK004_03375 [bacterium CG10_46_32]|nr:MAG: hypothetical protein BK004_03375 [bacterium CG10_46_32]
MVRTIVGWIFFMSVFIWFIYFFLFSKNFQIKNIHITGNKNIPGNELRAIVDAELAKKQWAIIPNKNSLFVPVDDIAEQIRKQYIIDNITVRKKPPFGLSIELTEKLSRVVLRIKTPIQIIQTEEAIGDQEKTVASTTLAEVSHNNVTEKEEQQERVVEYTESLYYLDVNGIVVSQLPPATDVENLPVIEIIRANQSDVNPGDIILSREIVELIFSLYERLLVSNKSIVITYVSYDPGIPQELLFMTTEGWQTFLSTQIPLETQIQKLELALQEKIKDGRSNLQYIDLRVKDRVYFK